MTNPLSSYGYSDEDYETAIGMMVGESSNHSTGQTLLHEMAGQLDVALNRLGSRQTGGRNFGKGRGLSLQDVILSPSQFDAATKTKGRAHKEQYSPAKRAALDDEYLATLTPAMQSRVLAAREAAIKTAGTKELRGITKNATTTSSTGYKLSAARAREHNKEGRKTATKIGGTSFYGKGHDRKRSQEQAAAISTKLDQRASTSAPRADTPKERNLSGMTASRTPDYSQFGPLNTPRESIPAEARAPYSPAALDFGPDFTSPPSQARGAVTDPYGFSNINTAQEAVPGSFAGYGPGAFGALDQVPTDYGTTYPDISAGLYDRRPRRCRMRISTPFSATCRTIATGSVRNAQMSFAPAVNAAQSGGPYSFSNMQSYAPTPDAATIPNDVTGYGAGGAFGSRAPSPAFDFESVFNATPMSGAAPANAPAPQAQPATTTAPSNDWISDAQAFNGRMSDLLQPGPTPPAEMSPFQSSPLGVGAGIIDQGPYSSPLGPNPNSFAPSNLAPAAVSTQAPRNHRLRTRQDDYPRRAEPGLERVEQGLRDRERFAKRMGGGRRG